MCKVIDWLDSCRFPGDWAVAKEHRRRQAVLEKRTVIIAEDDPESLAIKGTNDDNEELDNDPN